MGIAGIAGIGCYIIGCLVSAIGGIMILVAAFREGVMWGLGCLFLPFVNLIFVIVHWYEAKKGFLTSLVGFAIAIGGVFLAGSGFVPVMNSMIESKGESLPVIVPDVARSISETLALEPAPTKDPKAEMASYVGRLMREVRDELGAPKGEMEHSGMVFWYYDDMTVISEDGGKTVTTVQGKTDPNTVPTRRAKSPATTRRARAESVKVISNGGRQVSLREVLVPGKVTIVDFYADWCPPCRALDPKLKELARKNSNVVLRKIDIVQWHTPVARQHGIGRIPYVGVFGPNGRQVGRYTSSFSEVVQLVNSAQRR